MRPRSCWLEAQENVNERWKLYQHMASMNFDKVEKA